MRRAYTGTPVHHEQTVRLSGPASFVARRLLGGAGGCLIAAKEGLTLLNFSAQGKHLLWDTWHTSGGCRVSVTGALGPGNRRSTGAGYPPAGDVAARVADVAGDARRAEQLP